MRVPPDAVTDPKVAQHADWLGSSARTLVAWLCAAQKAGPVRRESFKFRGPSCGAGPASNNCGAALHALNAIAELLFETARSRIDRIDVDGERPPWSPDEHRLTGSFVTRAGQTPRVGKLTL
jgi:hypothetical protein